MCSDIVGPSTRLYCRMADGLCSKEGYLCTAASVLVFYIQCPELLSNSV
jgi:hypothetical protein